ncbi:hypothetical protein G4B88_022928 [Cannabis sativa]|uniref:Uncharacterized protein n=1 Tax=Cannabis sativa TaxID=3483 RepID=A0A7J6G536_CANSA|nr:hypothetical protein G4B88_022928 [Cannabis sativa]
MKQEERHKAPIEEERDQASATNGGTRLMTRGHPFMTGGVSMDVGGSRGDNSGTRNNQGEALIWFQWEHRRRPFLDWENFGCDSHKLEDSLYDAHGGKHIKIYLRKKLKKLGGFFHDNASVPPLIQQLLPPNIGHHRFAIGNLSSHRHNSDIRG